VTETKHFELGAIASTVGGPQNIALALKFRF
jgi:hypothetical protein